jgi:hypothetical protein
LKIQARQTFRSGPELTGRSVHVPFPNRTSRHEPIVRSRAGNGRVICPDRTAPAIAPDKESTFSLQAVL